MSSEREYLRNETTVVGSYPGKLLYHSKLKAREGLFELQQTSRSQDVELFRVLFDATARLVSVLDLFCLTAFKAVLSGVELKQIELDFLLLLRGQLN